MPGNSAPRTPTAPFAALMTHPVVDADRWKEDWDRHEPDRREVGVLGHRINRSEDDPRLLSVFMPLSNIERVRAFVGSPDRAAEMERAGVTGPPEIDWLKPLRDSSIGDRRLPACIVRLRLSDVDQWLASYDETVDMAAAGGLIGRAAHSSLDDPELVIAYVQAETFDTLRTFFSNPGLDSMLEAAGVLGAPETTFYTGGWASTY